MKFLLLTIKNLDDVFAIEQQAHTHPWSKAVLSNAFIYNHLIGLYSQHILMGFAIMLNSLDAIELLNIAVAPAYQNQGYGFQLLQSVIAFAQQKKISRVILEVRVSNKPARILYQHYGFTELHRRPKYYPSEYGREDAIVMEYQM